MDADWLHCNKCFRLKATTSIELHFAQCQHIICTECLGTTCPVCDAKVKLIKIDSSMPMSIKSMFEDFEASLQRVRKAMEFQWMQRTRLEAAKLRTLNRFAEVQKEIKRMKKGLILLTEDANKEKYKLSKAKEHLAYLMRYKSKGMEDEAKVLKCKIVPGCTQQDKDENDHLLSTQFEFPEYKDNSKEESVIDSTSSFISADVSSLRDSHLLDESYATQRNQFLKGFDPDKSADSGFGSAECKARKQPVNDLFE